MKFEEWVDVEGLTPAERARLERVHELLLDAGPPAALPSGLERPPGQVIAFPAWRRRTVSFAAAAAAAVAAAAFGGGYLVGDRHGGMKVTQVVAFQGPQSSLAALRVGPSDEVGNTPMVLSVKGLPKLEHGYYELWVWGDGKPRYPCTGFKMLNGKAEVHFSVPYELDRGTELVITVVQHGKHAWPGKPVMRSV
jgi:hypothetical protein